MVGLKVSTKRMSCLSRETEIINRLDTHDNIPQTDPNGGTTPAAGLGQGGGDVRHPL